MLRKITFFAGLVALCGFNGWVTAQLGLAVGLPWALGTGFLYGLMCGGLLEN